MLLNGVQSTYEMDFITFISMKIVLFINSLSDSLSLLGSMKYISFNPYFLNNSSFFTIRIQMLKLYWKSQFHPHFSLSVSRNFHDHFTPMRAHINTTVYQMTISVLACWPQTPIQILLILLVRPNETNEFATVFRTWSECGNLNGH